MNFLMISGHDYRSPRKANVHFIADELKKRGKLRFFSIGFSVLSKYNGDPRNPISKLANKIGVENGVECFLWKTPIHPFNMRYMVLYPLEILLFKIYKFCLCRALLDWIEGADVILFESGMSPILIEFVRKRNRSAKLIYIASDDVNTIGCSRYINEKLIEYSYLLDGVRVPSKRLADQFPENAKKYFVPHGIDPSIDLDVGSSPYGAGLHAVSVGSMLFDASFFNMAAQAFPEITFHVIGPGAKGSKLSMPNIRIYKEMKFRDTIPYIKHASFGIAPYSDAEVPEYLVDTSMKLMQYGYFGLPSVCPDFVAGDYSSRFAYRPGDAKSIECAINRALSAGKFEKKGYFLDWEQVTDRILAPENYLDTKV